MKRDLLTQCCGNGESQESKSLQANLATILGERHPPGYYGS
jgi:hypothetical protein